MNQSDYLCHFHKVETALWFDVARCLRRLCVAVLEKPTTPVAGLLQSEDVDEFLLFLSQMEYGYVHPRRTSARFSLSPHGRSAAALLSAYPSTN